MLLLLLCVCVLGVCWVCVLGVCVCVCWVCVLGWAGGGGGGWTSWLGGLRVGGGMQGE